LISVNYRRLPIRNAYNVRDIGGYPCQHGERATLFRSFVRADDLSNLDDEDVGLLLDYGVRTVIDIRSAAEARMFPDVFEGVDGVEYVGIPFIVGEITDITKEKVSEPVAGLKDFYKALVSGEKDSVRMIFECMAAHDEGVILYHCTAGKDRTGIITMLLLMLAGVPYEDIMADYMVSWTYNKRNPVINMILTMYPLEMMYSEPEYLDVAIDHIRNEYGNARNYLAAAGVSDSDMDKVITRLCG